MKRSQFCTAVVLLLAAMSFAPRHVTPAAADAYPDKTVRIIIPFSAGGAADVMLRTVAQHLSEKWGQAVVVDNRPGGNSIIGTTAAARSAPDGYTLYFAADQTITLNPALYSLPYDPKNDFVPISLLGAIPHILAVHKDVPAKTVDEFVSMAKAKPNHIMYGSSGAGSMQRLAMEYFSKLAGIKLVHVPYKGSNELTTGVLGGEVQVFFNGASNITPHMQSGALRGLAISTTQRVPSINLPTVREAGVAEYSSQGWFGLLAPRGTPPAILKKVETDVAEILNRADVKRGLEQRGFVIYAMPSAEFATFIADETVKWQRVVQEANIKPD